MKVSAVSQADPLVNAQACPCAAIAELKSWGVPSQLQAERSPMCLVLVQSNSQSKSWRHVLCMLDLDGQEGRWGELPSSSSVSCSKVVLPKQELQRCFIYSWNRSGVLRSHPSSRYKAALNELPSRCQVCLFSCQVFLWLLHGFFF